MRVSLLTIGLLLGADFAPAQPPPLLPEPVVQALATELSGEAAHRTVEALALHHRMRGSRPFRAGAEHLAEGARAAGLADVRIEEFPTDGEIFYGTQRSRPAWNAEFAELWELRDQGGEPARHVRWASWDAQPMTLAQDSESGHVIAELVDVGAGTSVVDYAGTDVRGKLVLTSSQPGSVAPLAVGRFGAVGIVSYAQNQRTAWWGEDGTLIRWGHLDTFSPERTFGFMVSPNTARQFQQRLARGERVLMEAIVRAGQEPGNYDVVVARIKGAHPELRQEEIVFTCHLDHPRPGANDNASGCAAILEVGRALNKLIQEGRLERPARTITFVWPPEIEGTLAILSAHRDWARRVRAVVHLDMVGGGPETKAIFRVTRGPGSLPHFVYDVGAAFGEFVNRETERFASGAPTAYPLVAPEGGREALMALFPEFTMGSDHQIYTEGTWRIPAIYLHDWPDRYIHTTGDTPAMIDPTKLKRSAFIAAASGYFLANMGEGDVDEVTHLVELGALRRAGRTLERLALLPSEEQANLRRFHHWYEHGVLASIDQFAARSSEQRQRSEALLGNVDRLVGRGGAEERGDAEAAVIFQRNPDLEGPMTGFGYAYLPDFLGEERTAELQLLGYRGNHGAGPEYAYEVLNLVDGDRSVQQIRNDVSAIYGPVPLSYVIQYLNALEEIDVVRR